MTRTMVLADYYAPEKGISRSSETTMFWSIRSLDRWAGREVDVDDLSPELLNRWIADRLLSVKTKTVKRERGDVLSIWKHAYETRRVAAFEPSRVRKVRVVRSIPQGPSIRELKQLLAAARLIPGRLKNGVPKSLYFDALISAAWDTGLRRQDLFDLRLCQVSADGLVAITVNKTGLPHVCRMRPETVRMLVGIGIDPPLQWPHTIGSFDYWCGRIKHWAGVSGRGLMHQIRRSSASYVEKNTPGSATAFLGHRTPQMARDSYLVPSIVQPDVPMPPKIA